MKNICFFEGSSALKEEVAGSCETLVNTLPDCMVLIPLEDGNALKGCKFKVSTVNESCFSNSDFDFKVNVHI